MLMGGFYGGNRLRQKVGDGWVHGGCSVSSFRKKRIQAGLAARVAFKEEEAEHIYSFHSLAQFAPSGG